MALVPVYSTLMLPEMLVVESLLEAYGLKTTTFGRDIVSVSPQFAILFGGIQVFVEEEQADTALALIASAENVPGYKSIESDGFERNPIRNALLAFVISMLGAPFPFWYRRAT